MPNSTSAGKASRQKKTKQSKRPTPLWFLRGLTRSKSTKLIQRCKRITKESNWKLKHLRKTETIKDNKTVRQLIIKEALAALRAKKPRLCIRLVDAYFAYYSDNLQADLIKAQANDSLGKSEEALSGLRTFSSHRTSKLYPKACRLSRKIIAGQAKKIATVSSPEQAITHYFEELYKLKINPEHNNRLDTILEKLDFSPQLSSYPELRQHELKLRFNSKLTSFLEQKLLGKAR